MATEHLATEHRSTDRQHRAHLGANRPVGSLLGDLTHELADLVSNEIALARAEAAEKVGQVGGAGGSLVMGGAIAYAGLLFLLAAAAAGIAQFLPADMADWLAPLIVGALVAIIGYAMVHAALNRLRATNLAPRRTLRSLHKDKELASDALRGNGGSAPVEHPSRPVEHPSREHVR